jgi:predicted RNA-binding protein with PIN domain
VVVVFDGGRGTREHVHVSQMGRIQLLYSARGQTADDVIVSHARILAASAQVVVVTNDIEVREHCRAEGCDVSGSENLLGQLPGHISVRGSGDREDFESRGTLSTEKRGNPRRTSRKARKQRDFRF